MFHSIIFIDGNTGSGSRIVSLLKEPLAQAGEGADFLGCFVADIGRLNRVLVLHGAETLDALAAETARITSNPELGSLASGIVTDFFRPFAGRPPITPGTYGPVFEIRIYTLRPYALAAMEAAWAAALPKRLQLSRLVGVMGSITGKGPRVLQIWPYETIQQRFDVRAEATRAGIWPPAGGRDRLQQAQSEIYFAAPYSPIN